MEKPFYTLSELCICAASEAWRDGGEVLATGIGLIPRLAASLAKMTHSPELMMTDGEAYLVSEPVPVGPRGNYHPKIEGYMNYSRVFLNIGIGHRHAMTGPVQMDKYGQTNISFIGDNHLSPKAQLLGARGFPGNTINHTNSMFFPNHNNRCFVGNEVDMVSGVGYNPSKKLKGMKSEFINLGLIISNLSVMDFKGPNNQIQVKSLHPGVEIQEVIDNTGFELLHDKYVVTPTPSNEQLSIIRDFLDPHNLREQALPDRSDK
tara:strand:- start:5071 stop:5856 length:786 start_codon:yes stop_codon:yes gene_type:complete